ncbi:hypothetical protein TW85_18270 [Marinomonas sp. S3726]|nr:hypothetical protein TW85_18270 [Marinomonas sp. S3726]
MKALDTVLSLHSGEPLKNKRRHPNRIITSKMKPNIQEALFFIELPVDSYPAYALYFAHLLSR